MKKLFLLIALIPICLGINAQGQGISKSNSSNLVTVNVSLQLSSGITDWGTTVSYYKNGVRHNEELTKGVMSHSFNVDKDKGFEISFLIGGGNTLRATGPNYYGEIETREIKYADPCTDGLSYSLAGDYTNLIFTFTSEDW